ncbi:MAG TPA: hypothetical protein VGG63_16445 [Steroidobacteraceae bacterium]|jgi:hypothetical protein
MSEIDSLTVGVGLTQEDFQAGVSKILKSLEGLQGETAAAGTSMTESLGSVGSSVVGLGLKFAGLFIAVKGIEDVVGYFKNLSSELSNLSYASEYLGQSVPQLARFGEVAKLAGGQAQDAISGIEGLQQSIFGLEFQGQISQNLLMLQRLGVAYLDTAGHMRNIKDIAMESAAALQQMLPGKANEPTRVQWAAQIFGAGGIANAVGAGLTDLRTYYAKATSEQKAVTQKAADEQRKVQQNLTELSYVIKNDATKALNDLTPQIKDLIKVIRDRLVPVIDEVIEDILHPLNAIAGSAAAENIVGGTVDAFKNFGRMMEEPFMRRKIEAGKIPGSVLARLPSGITNNPDYPNALDVLKIFHFEAGGDADDPNWSKAITNYVGFYGDNATRAATDYKQAASQGRPGATSRHLPVHALSTPGAARPAAGSAAAGKPTASTGGPRVTIGSIAINTAATDARGIAASLNRELERKILVGQSDPGLA